MKCFILLVSFFFLFPFNLLADTLYVPSTEYPTIEAGVNAALYGDVVLVASGTYYENSIQMKNGVSLVSQGGASSTIIDAQGLGRAFRCHGNDSQTKIKGFTLTNGFGDLYAGGIYCTGGSEICIEDNIITNNSSTNRGAGINCNGAAPYILNNVISYNSAGGSGGAIDCNDASPIIEGNIINNNITDWYGGGISCHNSSPIIINNTITNNIGLHKAGGIYCEVNCFPEISYNLIANNHSGSDDGGGISIWNWSHPIISYNTIVGNTTDGSTGGIAIHNSSNPSISHCIIAFNNGAGLSCHGTSPIVSCTDIYGNGNNSICGIDNGDNIFEDPMFCDVSSNNFELDALSPCIIGPCGQIGVLYIGCDGAVSNQNLSWGAVKALYR